MCGLKKKKKHNLEIESYILFSGLCQDLKPWRQDARITLRDYSEEQGDAGGEAGYKGVFATRTG